MTDQFQELLWEGTYVQVVREKLVFNYAFIIKSKTSGRLLGDFPQEVEAVTMAAEIDELIKEVMGQ